MTTRLIRVKWMGGAARQVFAAMAALGFCALTWVAEPNAAAQGTTITYPDPIVTNDTQPTADTTQFVYADVFDLAGFLPGSVSSANIIYSFDAATDRYLFNGAPRLTPGVDSPVLPPSAKRINDPTTISNSGELDPDVNPLTPTIRDQILSPLAGTPSASNVSPGSVVASDTIVLYSSDGTTVTTSGSFIVYTVEAGGLNGEHDRLSAAAAPTPPNDFPNTSFDGWTSSAPTGNAQSTVVNGSLCITAGTTGANIGEWVSPYAIIPLLNNSVWRVRATMTTNQTTAGSVPLWDVYFQNLGTNPDHGAQAYLGDYFFLDNVGSANAVKGPSAGLNVFTVWYAPSALRTPQWHSTATGAYQPGLDGENDMRLVFRVLDVDDSGINAQSDSGMICLAGMTIDRFDLANEVVDGEDYALQPITNGQNGVSVADLIGNTTDGGGTTVDLTTGAMKLTPRDPLGWLNEITTVTPGDITNPSPANPVYGNGIETVDNYPIPWVSNTLYELTVEASAPDAAGENNGPDSLLLGIDAKTLELFADSYALSGFAGAPGMPKQTTTVGGTQIYTMFFWSNSRTLAAFPEAGGLRYRIEVLNTTNYNRDNVQRNQGGITIHSIHVKRVHFPGRESTYFICQFFAIEISY